MNLIEVRVTFAPYQFPGIHGGDDVEEEDGIATHDFKHEVSDRPDVIAVAGSGKMAVDHAEANQKQSNGPEGDLAEDVAAVNAGE